MLLAKRPSVELGCGFCSEAPVTPNLSENLNLWASHVRWGRVVGGGPLGPCPQPRMAPSTVPFPRCQDGQGLTWHSHDAAHRLFPNHWSALNPRQPLAEQPLAYSQPCLHMVKGARSWSPRLEGSSTTLLSP